MIDKRLCKKLFNKPSHYKMADEELIALQRYVSGVMMGSGYECKCYVQDFIPFQSSFKPNWQKLYLRYLEHNKTEWPVFGEKDGYIIFISDKDTLDSEKEEMLINWTN